MEHRLGRRVELDLPVLLRFRDGSTGAGIAVNLGPGGVFVRTKADPGHNCCVEVRLSADDCPNDWPDDWQDAWPDAWQDEGPILLPSLVVHRTEDGIGLMFRALDLRAEAVVARLLDREAPTHRPSLRAGLPTLALYEPG
jgi:hypothetical protein